ncbi:MAG: DUF4386 domain-containing protein [Rhodobacteraceae bacterium]|nr:DUF4386 domain-containing protein [Paracoccaceae bacterium]
MSTPVAPAEAVRMARIAGALYLVIILCGIWSEAAVRGGLAVPGDPAATAAHILEAGPLLRLSILADALMALADVGLAVLLYVLLRPAGPVLALMAMAFRLVQAAAIAAALSFQFAALRVLDPPFPGNDPLAAVFLSVQAHGYDLGLIFFGVNCLLVAVLLIRAPFAPAMLGWLIAAAGAVYLTGSILRFAAPGLWAGFQPAYLVPLVAEAAFCLWLLFRGPDRAGWMRAADSAARQR